MTTVASMTGFGTAAGMVSDLAWAWEMRSVNGRGLDLRLRLPPGFEALDQPLRKLVAAKLNRGNVSINLQTQRARTERRYEINRPWLSHLQQLAGEIRTHAVGGAYAPIRPEALLALRGVIESVDEAPSAKLDDEIEFALLSGAEEAVGTLAQSRLNEGKTLHRVLVDHLETIRTLALEARSVAASQPQAIQQRLQQTLAELREQMPPVSDERMAQEVALLSAKADVREEVDRLEAHVTAGLALLENGSPCGRKLEFLSQEFLREANTLGAKSQDLALTRLSLDLKATIDQVREQVANVE